MASLVRGLALGALVAVVAVGCAGEKKASTESFGSETTTTAPAKAKTGKPDEEPTTTSTVAVEPSVVDAGFSVYPASNETWATAGAVIANPSDKSFANFEVVFTLKAAGRPLATESTYLTLLPHGGEAYANVDIITNLTTMPDEVQVSVVTTEDGFYDPDDYTALPVVVTGTSRDEFFATVTGTIKNPTDQVLEFTTISCVLTSGGKIVGGISTVADTMAPGTDIAWEATNTFEGVTFDAARCSSAGDLT